MHTKELVVSLILLMQGMAVKRTISHLQSQFLYFWACFKLCLYFWLTNIRLCSMWPTFGPDTDPSATRPSRNTAETGGKSLVRSLLIILLQLINASKLEISVNDRRLSELLKYFVCVRINEFVCACFMYLGTHLCTFACHRETKSKVKDFGGAAWGFFGTYYEDHIQPLTDSYTEWASDVKSSVWEKIQTTVENYLPLSN